jgi:hypothetical protein
VQCRDDARALGFAASRVHEPPPSQRHQPWEVFMLPFVLALVAALHPQAPRLTDARAVSRAIAQVVASEEPLPNMTRERTAALLVVMAWHESRFQMHAVGDHGKSFCALQVQNQPWLADNPLACVRAGMTHLRASMMACPEAPLASYAGGCAFPSARAISASRMREAEKLEEKVKLAKSE